MTEEEIRKAFETAFCRYAAFFDRNPVVGIYLNAEIDLAYSGWQAAVAWMQSQQEWRTTDSVPLGQEIRVLLVDGSILNGALPQADGDFWWGGAGCGELWILPKQVEGWRPLPPLPKEGKK